MIDIRALRDDPDAVKAALARRGVEASEVDAVVEADAAWRAEVQRAEDLRAEVKELSRQVGQAKKAGDDAQADELSARSRARGEEERAAAADADALAAKVRNGLLYLPNLPAEDAPDGAGEEDNVEVRRWWPGQDLGRPEPEPPEHQRVPHWEIGEALQILDMERGARLAGSMFPLYRGPGARLVRALTAFALDRHAPVYEEILPPTVVLTDTMTSTGHLPKFADDAYHMERDDLWLIPTAEVPLTSMHRGEILEESQLPLRFTAATACYRREAGSAGRDTRGLLRVHEFYKVELFAYATPDGALDAQADILARAESMLQELELPYRVLDLCAGDLGGSSARTFDLEAFAPGVDRWLEVSSVSWFRDYQARRANVRYRPAGGGPLQLVHTVNGSALAWPRIWAALVENGRQEDGTVMLPEALAPYLGGELLIKAP
ncbi:MAG TPA: serine--tRNA ligase [Acidimicrobiales bacterium]|jgi:seryl-tRNA synthetase|nr:serine--tRNA ligase [Acidimicrobiales bacterium]